MKFPLRLNVYCFLLLCLGVRSSVASDVAVNVESYGAVANGSTDNSAAINNALAVLKQGQTLWFPCTAGSYYNVKSPINFGSLQYKSLAASGPGCYLNYVGSSPSNYAFSFVGAEAADIRNLDFMTSNSGTCPQTTLLLGRTTSNTQSGQLKFENVRVEGWATKAIVYSIASEEDQWINPTIILNGGGALYGFYTSGSDDLGIGNLPTASNLSLWMHNFHLYDFSPSIDPSHALIVDVGTSSATGNHTFRDGYLGSTNGTGFQIVSTGSRMIAWMALTIDSNRFENGYQMFNFTGEGSFGNISLTNNKSAGVSKYLINLPTRCFDCTFQGNNIQQADSATSVFGSLLNSFLSENYPYSVTSVTGTVVNDRVHGSIQIGSSNAPPACNVTSEGTLWYAKGAGALKLCQFTPGGYVWVTH